MIKSSRAVIILSLFLIGPMGACPAFSESQEKEGAPDKPASRPPQAPAASDNQPVPPKPSTEPKAQSQPALPKGDSSADHKEATPDKPASRPSQAPAASDNQPVPPKLSTEPKAQSQPSSPKGDSSTDHKEVTPEKPASRSAHPPAAADGQAAPHKPTEAKPQTQPAPAVKADPLPDKEKDLTETKEKEPVVKKPLGSLILSVKLALMGDSRLFRYEIEVEDDQQTITLTGRICSEEEKAVATEVAQTVHGVKAVVNKLSLEKDLAKTLVKKQDEILTSMVKERFAKSATLKAANFEVKTEEGVVQLNGTVRFQVIALEAAEAARQVPGVRAVNTDKIRLEGES
ncbi:MAG: BON domain-containing protein [Nitrospira sp.]|jgi:hyperosmotically inducible protein|nr:BON domain-containing protein [Nitrospira sp. BO4]